MPQRKYKRKRRYLAFLIQTWRVRRLILCANDAEAKLLETKAEAVPRAIPLFGIAGLDSGIALIHDRNAIPDLPIFAVACCPDMRICGVMCVELVGGKCSDSGNCEVEEAAERGTWLLYV
jgi:hypothetical protein